MIGAQSRIGMRGPDEQVRSEPGPDWPGADGRRVVFLLDASSPLERRLLTEWIERNRPARPREDHVETILVPPSRRRRSMHLDPRLEACLAAGDDPLLAPLRVAWQPRQRGGIHAVHPIDVAFGDPRDPGRLRQSWVLRHSPDRCRIVVGEPALASDLRARWQRACGTDAAQTIGLADFVALQAGLALERAERRLRGTRYKVPRFVHEEILARPSFRGAVEVLARELGRSPASVAEEAARDLREIAASHSPMVIDLVAYFIRLIYSKGYEALRYDRGRLLELFNLAQRYPVVFLPTHKSNLDHLVLQYALYENGLPPNHTAGGINMNFFPVGPLVRRSGVFFIRRTFKDDRVYKLVLRQYVDYLIEKRFSLEWYIEGGRSRSGKLLPPRFGLLAYVVDAYRRGRAEDVFLIPVSIAYDQIQDVGDYVAEQHGATKPRESFSWFVRVLRALRTRSGAIHLRFGEPLSVRAAVGPPDPGAEPRNDEQDLALQKLAFEVAVRINRVTPVTATSLVTFALLSAADRALTIEETGALVGDLLDYVRRRGLPTTGRLDLDRPERVRRALEALIESGVVSCFAEGPEPVYRIGEDQQLAAAYYRNTIIHFFVNGSIAELALLRAAEAAGGDRAGVFWDEVMDLRDLLKFEFFFAEKETFRGEMNAEVAFHDPDWESRLAEGSSAIRELIQCFRPYNGHLVLRPFLDAYRVVADALARLPPGDRVEEGRFLTDCLNLGRQYVLQRRIHGAESVSKVLFETALRLARNRRLVDPGEPTLAEGRWNFAEEIRDALRRVDAIDALARERQTRTIREARAAGSGA